MDFSNMTNVRELLAAGGPVLILLLLLSVYSISVILERFFKLRSSISLSRKLLAYCRHPIRSENYQKVEDACHKDIVKNTPAAALILRLVRERHRSDAELEKISDSIIDWEISKLQRRLTVLGTLGSITPFIGLFGTVIGVMHAFKDLASTTAAGAGASTKIVLKEPVPSPEGRGKKTNLIRQENVKAIDAYVRRVDEMIERKGEWL